LLEVAGFSVLARYLNPGSDAKFALGNQKNEGN
jgi:hypothetical protein